ncbi:MAG TPA: hypothetical protein VGN90_08070 [Pyrinomonadaceae bacterium]|nr:hypothetical protein [Pyrinomonadaceae bacterium]
MPKKIWTLSVLSLALIVSVAAFGVRAQQTLSGVWTASLIDEKSKVNLNLELRAEKNGKHQMGQTYEFSAFQGLTREQALAGGPVTFSIVREAGTIECQGSFQDGKGSGTFRFTANQAFVSAMKSRGFDFEKESAWTDKNHFEDRLFTATALNVTTGLADDLLSAGFGKLDVGDLFKAAIFKIDSTFMREMKASGFPNMGMEELVKARIFKIDAKFVSEATQMGFDKEPFESLVKMRIFKVTPAFIAEVRGEGLNALSIEDIVKLRIFKIDAEAIRKAKAEGVPLEVERLVQWRLGVDRPNRRVVI